MEILYDLMHPYFIILLCLLPDDLVVKRRISMPLNGLTKQSGTASSQPTLFYHITLSNGRLFYLLRGGLFYLSLNGLTKPINPW